ncbi:MAG: AAA family ATPase, partial [Caulobacterales bacterium]|nr:AAA family ATPase [Caulobacterales bacterium]
MAHAYLSYVGDDDPTAAQIKAGFAGADISLHGGADGTGVSHTLPAEVEAGIAESFAFIAVMSPNAYDSPRMRIEMERAIERDVPILPVRVGETPLPVWWAERIGDLREVRAGDGVYVDTLVRAVSRFHGGLCPVVSLMNLKGGVGKTTLTAQVFAALQRDRQNRVLLIDLDPQHNLSQLFFRRSTQDTLIYMDT